MVNLNVSRSQAREIALGCLFECFFRNSNPLEVLDYRLASEEMASLAEESDSYERTLNEASENYIRDIVTRACENDEQLFTQIKELAVGWRGERISIMTKSILSLSMTEILFRSDVPMSSSINEAVELAKKYDSEKAPAFINGILGAYVRNLEVKTNQEKGRCTDE